MFNVYGDESIGPEYVAYAAIVVPENRTADAVAVLTALKEETGATAEDVLHCRQLFSGQQRQKTAWHSKSMAEVFDIYSKLLSRLAPTISRTIVSLGRISDFPTSISGDQWRHIDPNLSVPCRGATDLNLARRTLRVWVRRLLESLCQNGLVLRKRHSGQTQITA
jgi:hypothetical protein